TVKTWSKQLLLEATSSLLRNYGETPMEIEDFQDAFHEQKEERKR
ncbi:hypothetical protein X975_13147, partial [Stegodyphus mimosarum]